jgi:hypothetical protein
VDHDRVQRVKRLLYDTHKQNIGVLKISDLADSLESLVSNVGYGRQTFTSLIFDR